MMGRKKGQTIWRRCEGCETDQAKFSLFGLISTNGGRETRKQKLSKAFPLCDPCLFKIVTTGRVPKKFIQSLRSVYAQLHEAAK